MKKSLLGLLIGSAFAFSGTAHAGLVLDLNGSLPGGVIEADALDWAPTSFLAKGGNTAIQNYVAGGGGSTEFEVLTHAKLTAYKPTGSSSYVGLPNFGGGEITMVAKFTENVINFNSFGNPANPVLTAAFQSTGAGWVEFYWSPAADSVDLTGANFNNGTLIGRLDGVARGVIGTFTVSDNTPIDLDQTSDGINNYPGQKTVSGSGSQGNLLAGTTGVDLDPNFFLTMLTGFALDFENISIGLPFRGTNPSDAFVDGKNAAAVGASGLASSIADNHVLGDYDAQGSDGGYRPVVGPTNGFSLTSPDFIAQTDFNSAVTGDVPEPGTLALVGLALGTAGFAASRRRRG